MRKILAVAAGAALMLAGGALAQPRDTPPPGCRWFGDDLGCKDGRGNYRRAGDDAVIGRYAAPRPKPKPKPRPVAAPAVTEAPPSAQDLAGPNAPATQGPMAAEEASANVSANEGFGLAPAAPEAAAAPVSEPAAPPAAAPAKPKPWWQAFWDWLVNDIMSLLRRLGLAK